MKEWNDFVSVKFNEQEDLKNSIRDIISYLRLYIPQTIQMQIYENFQKLFSKAKEKVHSVFEVEAFYQFQNEKLD